MQSSINTASRNSSNDPNGGLELCAFAEQNLYTAVVSDSLDQLGVRHQAMGIPAAGTRAMQVPSRRVRKARRVVRAADENHAG